MRFNKVLKTHFLLILSCVSLTQCGVVGVNYSRPKVPTPDGWTRALAQDFHSSASQIDNWWKTYGDSSLNTLIARVKAYNKDIRIAAQSISITRLKRGVSSTDLIPKINASASVTRSKSSKFNAGANIGGTNLYDSSIDASWEADVFGGLRRNLEAAQRNEEAAFEMYRDLLVTLYAETTLNYIDYRTLQARISIAKEQIRSQQKTVALAKELFEAGLSPKVDLLQAKANLNTTRAQIPQLKAQLLKTRNRLAALTGQYPSSVNKILARSKSIPSPRRLRSIGMPANLLRARPDVRAAERELAAQIALIGVAEAELYPKFRLFGKFALQSKKLGKLIDGRSAAYGFGPSLEWNIFSAGKIRKQIKIQEARTEQSMLKYEKTVLTAVEEVENSMAEIAYERDRYKDLNKAYKNSKEATNLVKENYSEGLIDFQRVLDTERSTFTLKDKLAVSKGAIAKNYAQLYKALGGGTIVSNAWIATPRTRASHKDKKNINTKD